VTLVCELFWNGDEALAVDTVDLLDLGRVVS
jgi:hypothetical protein